MKSALFIVPLVALLFPSWHLKNTCKSFASYFNIFFSKDCYYNPDIDDDISGIIRRHVGVYESHEVQTDDGYILSIFRIPRENPKGVILFQHSLGSDARLWVSQYNESIAFLFWRAGYDVWLGNTRGNYFCKKHVSLEPTETAFWNFSFHEMGHYDNHAIIEYIRQQTDGSKIIYAGFSLGGTSGMVYASTRVKEAAESIKMIVLMAPATHIRVACTSFMQYVVGAFYNLQDTFHFANPLSVVNGNDVWYTKIYKFLLTHFSCKKCVLYLNSFFVGRSDVDVEPDLINMHFQIYESECPLKLYYHFYQMFSSDGSFRMYDYGEKDNLVYYGQHKSPEYPLAKIKVPVFVVYGEKDNLVCPSASEKLYNLLPRNSTQYGKLMVKGFNHGDFTHGRYRNERVYYKILRLLENNSRI